MGEVPPDFKSFPELTMFGNQTSLKNNPKTAPNGVDFWWDEAMTNTGNCWPDNTGPDGTHGSLTADPPIGQAGQSAPGTLPENCASSIGGAGYAAKVPGLLACFGQWESGDLDAPGCTWFNTPPQPGSRAAKAESQEQERLQERVANGSEAAAVQDWVSEFAGGQISLGPQG